jgi:hypothetical protein
MSARVGPGAHAVAARGPALAWAIVVPALAAVSALVWWEADPAKILEDTLQHIGVARSVLRGDGLETTLLYYDVQYEAGTVPAPQTVWPPGIALGIAGLASVGIEPSRAALLLAWLSLVVAALSCASMLARVVNPTLAGIAALGWTLCAANWISAATGASELPFVACMLATTAGLMAALRSDSERTRLRWLCLAGTAAAAAVAVRYVGVVFVATAGCVLVCALRGSWWRRLLAGTAFGAIPGAVTIAIGARNVLATGHLAGGQLLPAAATTPADALARTAWSVLELLGLPRSGPLGTLALATLALLAAIVGLVTIRIAVAALRPRTAPGQAKPRRQLLAFALAYCGVTGALHLYWAVTLHVGMLDPRYFEPLLPFGWTVVAVAAQELFERRAARPRTALAICAALAAGFAWLQWQHWRETWPGYASVANDEAIVRALATPFGARTVGEWLAVSNGTKPIVATLEHSLHARLDRPVLGLSDSRYTTRVWDAAAVRDLMSRYRACVVLFVPGRFPVNAAQTNLPFFRALASGAPPAWLTPVLRTPDVELYSVADDDSCRALAAPGGPSASLGEIDEREVAADGEPPRDRDGVDAE